MLAPPAPRRVGSMMLRGLAPAVPGGATMGDHGWEQWVASGGADEGRVWWRLGNT